MTGEFPGVDIDAAHMPTKKQAPKRRGIDKPCLHCGKTYRWRWSHPEKKFCSKPCANAGRTKDKIEAFWEKVQKGDGCWSWTAAKHRDGYGMVNMDTGIRKAHRVAWEVTHGQIPDGMDVCHTCDNPICCNPAHLWLGTHNDNMADRVAKGRTLAGQKNFHATLTDAQAAEIRRLFKRTSAHRSNIRELAEMFGVKYGVVLQIVNGRTYLTSPTISNGD
jgi:hypothetical protein